MPELTSILRERLGAGEDPKVHPDPDTLTAYVEGVLPTGERGQVLLHISLCNQCRDVVALTMPEGAAVEEEPAVAVAALPAPRRAWFLGPRFGLVASVLAMAAGVFLVLKIPQQNPKTAPVLTAAVQPQTQPAEPATATSSELAGPTGQAATRDQAGPGDQAVPTGRAVMGFAGSGPAPAPAASLRAAERRPSAPQKSRAAQVVAAAPPPQPVVTAQNQPAALARAARQDYLNHQLFANPSFAAELASAPRVQEIPQSPRSANPTFAFNKQSSPRGLQNNALLDTASSNGTGSQGTATIYTFTTSSSNTTSFGFAARVTQLGTKFRLKRLAPAISTENANNYAMFRPGLSGSTPAEVTAKTPADASPGQALAQSSAFTPRAVEGSALNDGGTPFWRISQGRLLKSSDMNHWTNGYPASEGIEFTVVTASGADVWAGGKNAALIHSRDGGLTWERVTLGASAAGAISSIEVSHSIIQVRNSSGQGWLSQDGGHSWSLQN
jgi:hypothetical protein